jgi:GT2 family glycosyltransferase
MYIYVPEWNKLYFRKNGGNNILVPWVQGASLFVKKNVFKKVMFPDKNKGEDTHFGHEVRKKGFRTFAAPINDFVVIRRLHNKNHTWLIDLKQYLRYGVPINVKKFKGKDKHVF